MTLFSSEFLKSRYLRPGSQLFESSSSKKDPLTEDLEYALNLAENKIGGSGKAADSSSYDSIKRILDRIPSEMIKEEKPNPFARFGFGHKAKDENHEAVHHEAKPLS